MASGDFADLKLQLAYLSGRATVAQLDTGDQALAGQCVNEAYLDCYQNPGGNRPGWALQTFGIRLRAPLTPSIGVTLGSRVVTGYSFPTDTVGSTIQIGSNFYTYAGLSGSNEMLVEPCMETTGTYTANLWHDSYPLDANVVEVQDAPVVMGWGILAPMNSRKERWRWKQITYGDFTPHPGAGGYFTSSSWPGGINFPTGNPLFYLIDNSSLVAGNAIKNFFIVEPMPIQLQTIQFQGWIVPTELSADGDLPVMPASLITRVLFPLIRERWATVYKKYTGDNLRGLVAQAAGARQILNQTSRGQRDSPVRVPLRNV